MPEFANSVSAYKGMLWAHDKKLRNTKLLPLIKKAQVAEPLVPPNQAFKENSERYSARTKIARVRAKICYLTLLEDEAKVEGLYSVNTSTIDRLTSMATTLEQKSKEVKDLEAWVESGGLISRRHFDSYLMRLAISKQLTGNILDQFIMTPMKDQGIAVLQSMGIFDGGWKSSAEANFEKYKQSVIHLGPIISFLKTWVGKKQGSLTYQIGQNYIISIASGGGAGIANQNFSDLLGNYDFSSRTRGGVPNILEIQPVITQSSN